MACTESPATSVAPTTLPTASPTSPTVSTTTRAFELTGVAVGDDGRPVANAPVYVNFGRPAVTARTDDTGRYRVNFDVEPNAYSKKLEVTAMIYLDGNGYEHEYRWFRPTGSDPRQILDLHPRRIQQITAGESVSVTVARDDTPCINNVQDIPGLGSSYVCRTVRVIVPADGVLTVAASANSGAVALLEMEATTGPDDCCFLGTPLTLAVTAGRVVKVNVEILEGSPSQTFTLTTRMR